MLTDISLNPEDNSKGSDEVHDRSVTAVDDIMIKDPFCETYFPKRDGVHLHFEGEDLIFCSAQCRDGFLSEKKDKRKFE